MLTFLLYTVVFWAANICFVRIANILIQPGQLLGGWQKVLARMYESKSRFVNELAKPLGDCELCFSHFLTFLSFWGYVLFMKVVIHHWITEEVSNIILVVILNIIWYVLYASIGTIASLIVLIKTAKKP